MLAFERQNKIIEILETSHLIKVDEIAESFGVTPTTIRRDINELKKSGVVNKIHGGAILSENRGNLYLEETKFKNKKEHNLFIKNKIASEGSKLVKNGMTVYLDAGTTNLQLALMLKNSNLNLIIVTNDLNIASKIYEKKEFKIIFLGGEIECLTGASIGLGAIESAQNINFDLAFFGASVIDENLNILSPEEKRVKLKNVILKNSAENVLLVDSEKFGKKSIYKVFNLTDLSHVITDYEFSKKKIEILSEKNVKVIKV